MGLENGTKGLVIGDHRFICELAVGELEYILYVQLEHVTVSS
jgi:hypothetical protein